jgi:CDP-glycerol glycerophosphotransferase (TagB/SpsB family)
MKHRYCHTHTEREREIEREGERVRERECMQLENNKDDKIIDSDRRTLQIQKFFGDHL